MEIKIRDRREFVIDWVLVEIRRRWSWEGLVEEYGIAVFEWWKQIYLELELIELINLEQSNDKNAREKKIIIFKTGVLNTEVIEG